MLTDFAILILAALCGNWLFSRCGLPGILGMVAAGIILGPGSLNLMDEDVLEFLKEFKTVALIVILIRAGLGINKETLNRIGGPAIRMGFLPCIMEGTAVTLTGHLLFDLPIVQAGMLGFIIAAVSPAVVVPQMLELKEGGYGKKREVPTLILAGASVDDVFAITIFGAFASLAMGHSTNWLKLVIGLPLGILAGAAIGIAIGLFLVWFFRHYHLRDTKKVILFIIISVIFYEFTELPAVHNVLPIAALLGIMAIGFVILERYELLANRLALKFQKVWVLAEILLFAYIGTELRIQDLSGNMIVTGLIVLAIGLLARSGGVWLSLLGSELNANERRFCAISYLPKATVQAAMGAVPLTMVLQGKIPQMSEENGKTILAIAVLSIVVTAPLGAIGVKLFGPRLLSQE